MSTRPRLLFYCQHAVGLGHLARSLALADGLAAAFDVVLLNGGRLPTGTTFPVGVEVVNLPALGHDDTFDLVSHESDMAVDEIVAVRPRLIAEVFDRVRPDVVLIELFPFGRKKFAFELLPLLESIEAMGSDRPLVACSLRDILVGSRRDQAAHDERAALRVNRFFDVVLMHSDPVFARIEDSFRPLTPLVAPVRYTGFVAPPAPASLGVAAPRLDRVIVSAGGGSVGGPIIDAALAGHRTWWAEGLSTTIVTGPFCPDDVFARAGAAAEVTPGLEVVRYVSDLCGEIRRSAVSVSQCGYNTAMDLLRAGTPAVVVPYSEGREDEQRRRAAALEDLGVLRSLDSRELDGASLAALVLDRRGATPNAVTLDLDGRHHTADILRELLADRPVPVPVPVPAFGTVGA